MSSSIPLSNAEQLREKILSLQIRLQQNLPDYAGLLHTIHKQLSQDESLVHLLTDEEVGVIVSGLAKRKGIVIASSVSKSKSMGGKSLKSLDLEDL